MRRSLFHAKSVRELARPGSSAEALRYISSAKMPRCGAFVFNPAITTARELRRKENEEYQAELSTVLAEELVVLGDLSGAMMVARGIKHF